MTPERWQQIEHIFHTAAGLETGARTAYLVKTCGDDLALRQEVESLLASKGRPVSIMDAPLKDAALRLIASQPDGQRSGRMLAHYQMRARLGAGGMGEVFLAVDTKLGRKVALKLLPHAFTRDEDQVRRFQQEARAASALNHPNIITVHEIGRADETHYIAMEFVQGETLRQRMRGGRLPVREALDVAAQVAGALAAAHHAGIVHRDIKPENVMRRDDGYVKVLDFGIAKLRDVRLPASGAEEQVARDAASSAVFGTAGYMSPEQARGEPLDARTDLFSLGVLLYEMVAGRRPFTGDAPADALRALREDEPPALSVLRQNLPRALAEIAGRALRKNRDERYQSARELLDDLSRLKQQLDQRAAGEEPTGSTAAQESVTSTLAVQQGGAKASHGPRAAARRYAFWLLPVGALAVIGAGLDKLLLQPQGVWSMRDGVLLVCAVGCLLLYLYVRRQTARLTPATVFHDGAFRGLSPFQESDRDRFFGREEDTAALVAMTGRAAFRFGVLYGDSGAGKTSLLIAGLLPRLKVAGRRPLYFRSYKDPLAALLEECRKQTGLQPRDKESPLDYLRRASASVDAEIIAVCDQFEEFFVNFRTRREREPFTSFVAECHGATDLPVKFLFAIRSDFLHLVCSEFDGRIPEPLMGDKRWHLRNFDEEQAEEIIAKSAGGPVLPLEAALCRQVARDLAGGESVLPSELQIVGMQLQRRRIFTLREYQRAGGKEQLVHSFLADVIQASRDQHTTKLILRSLISDENTRLTLPPQEIARRTQRGRETVAHILKLLVESRLVREIQEEDPWRYELMHEYLIEGINRTTGKVLDATQRANRQFRKYLSEYAVDESARIPFFKLWLISRHSDLLRGERERDLLRKSLRRGLFKGGVVTSLLVLATTLLAAAASVNDVWDDVSLRDGHTAAVRRAVFSPDGRLLVSAGEDKQIIVWDFARRMRLRTLTEHTDVVTSVAFSPDGQWLATGSNDHTVIVWDAARLEKVKTLREHHGPVAAVAFSPDGRLLASASREPDDRTIIWQVGEWGKIGEMQFGFPYGTLLFSPNGRQLFLLYGGQTVDLTTGRQVAQLNCGNWGALSPDATRLVCASGEGDVSFWGLNPAGDLTWQKHLGSYRVHRDNARAAAFSPDGRLIATGAENIILWDAATQTRITRLEHTAVVWSLAFSPDGRWLVSGYGDGAILVWDVAERESVADLSGHTAAVRAVAFSADGGRVASASEDRSVIIWDAERGRKEAVLLGHRTRVTAVAFAPDGNGVASTDLDGNLIYWDVSRHEPRWAVKFPLGQGHCVAISADGRWVATSQGVTESAGGRKVFDCRNPDPRENIHGVYGAVFSADGRRLAFVTELGKVWLLDTRSWQVIGKAEVSATLIGASLSPDGKWLATGEDEGAVRLWSVEPLREVALLGRHAARVKSVAFSPDGLTVASASDDKTIALWDVASRRLITNVGTHAAPVLSVAFSPDGRQLASGEHDRSVRLYTRRRTLWGHRWD